MPVSERRLLIAVTTNIAVNMLVLPQMASLRDHGWQVHLVCSPGILEPEVVELAESVTMIPMARAISPVRDLSSVRAMMRVMRSVRPDVVVGSTPKAAMVSMIGARLTHVPVRVFQVRGARWEGESGIRAWLMRLGDRLAVRASTDVLAVSKSLAELLVASGVTHRVPVVLAAGGSKGVDTTVFFPDPDRAYNAKAPLMGYAGRLSIDKGLSELIAAFDSLSAGVPGMRMEIVGELDDAQSISSDLADRIRTSDVIDWIPYVTQPELAERMRRWDLLLFPSHREGLPNVVIEAAACGVPVVAWDVTGVRDAVDAPKGGRLVTLGDVDSFVVAARECLIPSVHESMVTHTAEWTAATFEARVLQQAFAQFLDSAADRARDATGVIER